MGQCGQRGDIHGGVGHRACELPAATGQAWTDHVAASVRGDRQLVVGIVAAERRQSRDGRVESHRAEERRSRIPAMLFEVRGKADHFDPSAA